MAKIGFIGMGNMGTAILRGLLKTFAPEDILFSSGHEEKMERISAETGVPHAASNAECARQVKYLVLAVKPQMLPKVFAEIKDTVTREQVIISIAAGYTISDLTEGLGGNVRVIRTMPNTPAMVGEGMTSISYDDSLFDEEEKKTAEGFFTALGKLERIDEKLMDVAASASGCSPAYVYMFIEALADGCVKNGLPRQTAYRMAAQAVLGSAKMVLETGKHPGELKDMVCSPGGTTIEGVAALEEMGFRSAVIKACDANFQKNKMLK